jgi:hypothetical protein
MAVVNASHGRVRAILNGTPARPDLTAPPSAIRHPPSAIRHPPPASSASSPDLESADPSWHRSSHRIMADVIAGE